MIVNERPLAIVVFGGRHRCVQEGQPSPAQLFGRSGGQRPLAEQPFFSRLFRWRRSKCGPRLVLASCGHRGCYWANELGNWLTHQRRVVRVGSCWERFHCTLLAYSSQSLIIYAVLRRVWPQKSSPVRKGPCFSVTKLGNDGRDLRDAKQERERQTNRGLAGHEGVLFFGFVSNFRITDKPNQWDQNRPTQHDGGDAPVENGVSTSQQMRASNRRVADCLRSKRFAMARRR